MNLDECSMVTKSWSRSCFAVASRASFRSPPLASSFSWLTLLRRTAPSTSCLRRSATESDSPCPSFQVWGRYVWAPRPKTCTPQDLCRRHPKLMFWQAMGLSLGLKNRCKDGECHHAGVSPRCTCKRRSATQKTSALELPAAGSQGNEEYKRGPHLLRLFRATCTRRGCWLHVKGTG